MSRREHRIGRRRFLRLAGMAGLAAGCSPKAATQHLVPYLVPPEDVVPGAPLFFRTLCRECSAACGVTARTREGRVVKLEGNPDDPVSRGSLCARGQAALQALYAPDRLRGPMRRGQDGVLAPTSWDDAEDLFAKALSVAREKGPGAIRLVTRPEPGSAGALQRALLTALGGRQGDRVVLDPFDPGPIRAANAALFGTPELPTYDLEAARSAVSFGAELVEAFTSPLEHARALAAGHARAGDARLRFTWAGPRLALTGVSADAWLRTRPGGELPLALGLLRWLVDPASGVKDLDPAAQQLHPALALLSQDELARRSGVPWERIVRLGRELSARRPSVLVGPGVGSQGTDATQLAAVLLLANQVLGNLGRTVLHGLDPREDPPSSFADLVALAADMAAGRVEVLLVHRTDPASAAPAALRLDEAIARVPFVVSFGDRPDGLTAHAHLVLPDHHTLESFGDATPRHGVVNLAQPVMEPLADTRSASQVLIEVANKLPFPEAHVEAADFREYVLKRTAANAPGSAEQSDLLATVQRAAQQRGGYYSSPPAASSPRLAEVASASLLALPPSPSGGDLALLVFPTTLRGDGSAPISPWLQEIPDTLSTVSWSGWAELSPATAARLGVQTGDLLAVTSGAGRAEIPAWVHGGLVDGALALPLGGQEARSLLPALAEARSGAQVFRDARASVRKAEHRGPPLPLLAGSPHQHGRGIVRTVSASRPALERPSLAARMYGPPSHPHHRWGMAIDLDRCTGCSACVVACFAENNVPVAGRMAALQGRYMGWIRIERYLADDSGAPLDVKLLPMLCQHCSNAPCEPVCPVYATYHTAEGLNAQVYNRCVGTRYCNNNCPYKVRTFNWWDMRFPRPLDMQLNPDVTVRSKGVMEKCTFCVQRIRYGENVAKDEGREVRDGEIVPACAQTCPAEAIVFGDLDDPTARVSRLSREGRGFAVMEELGTSPAITYLARRREGQDG